jgi:hypothetical protein
MKKILILLSISIVFYACKKEVVEVVINGCTDVNASNYNSIATNDNGSCIPYVMGCTVPTAFNYNPLANFNDGSCIAVANGCTDSCAVNYDANANANDGSCIYTYGCTDPAAINYDACAVYESGNVCEYTCDVVYYLDYSASVYMILNGISYYSFYHGNGSNLGYITSDYYWNFPPDCNPQFDGSTLTATLYWTGNIGSNAGSFSWSAYDDDGYLTYQNTTTVFPNECKKAGLTVKKIQDYKESK